MMANPIPICKSCASRLEQKTQSATLTVTHETKRYVFSNIPAQVCSNCGHSYFDTAMVMRLERLVRENKLKGFSG
jgi:YgiT-type zinc finger domain-containing protein